MKKPRKQKSTKSGKSKIPQTDSTPKQPSIFDTEATQVSTAADLIQNKPQQPEPVPLHQADTVNVAITDPMIDTASAVEKLRAGKQQDISYAEYLTLPVPVNLKKIRSETMLMICTPCYGGMVGAGFLRSMLQTQNLFNACNVNFTFTSLDNESLVTRARNNLVGFFLANPNATHLMFIDADISWSGEDILRMLHWDRDVVVGAYPKKGIKYTDIKKAVQANPDISDAQMEWHSSNYVTNMAWKPNPNNAKQSVADVDAHGNVRVLDAGTGFMIIKRSVIERIVKEMPDLKYVQDMPLPKEVCENSYSIFDTMHCPDSNRYLSEDYTFCRRWQKLGGEIWLDPRTQLNHWGGHTYKGNISKIFDSTSRAFAKK